MKYNIDTRGGAHRGMLIFLFASSFAVVSSPSQAEISNLNIIFDQKMLDQASNFIKTTTQNHNLQVVTDKVKILGIVNREPEYFPLGSPASPSDASRFSYSVDGTFVSTSAWGEHLNTKGSWVINNSAFCRSFQPNKSLPNLSWDCRTFLIDNSGIIYEVVVDCQGVRTSLGLAKDER